MTLPELSLRRPVFAIVANLLLVIVGVAALTQLPVRELPDVDTAEVTVSVTYEGAAPEVIDAEVTNPIEDVIAGIAGVRSISSESERGSNRTVIEFEAGRDIDVAANDVRAAVGRIREELPEPAEEPVVEKSDSENEPIIRLTLQSDRLDGAALTDYADRYIVDQIARLAGVASVQISGERAYAMRVWLDREAMASRGVTVADITEALVDNNVELPAGRIETPQRQFQVRTDTRLSQPGAFEEITIRRGDEGTPVRLGDVADVVRGVENDDSYYRANFESAIGLGVLRQSQSNTVAISGAVREELDRIRDGLPAGMTLEIASDDAIYINASIRAVLITLAIAVALVVGVIFVFLASVRATAIPALSIPIALVGAGAGLWAFGFSINVLTLFALILAIGLVVDDAIVVLENIQRRADGGEPVLAAAARGAGQVGFAVIATTLTLIAVFVPISFLQGEVGRLFTEFGIALAVAVAVSTFVALTIVPVLASRILVAGSEAGRFARLVRGALERLTRAYRASLGAALRAPWLVLGLAAVVAALAAAAYPRVPSALTPDVDRGVFFVNVSAPQGANLEFTDAVVREVEAVLRPYREDGPIDDVIAIVGRYDELRRAFLVATLVPWAERDRSTGDIVEEVRPQLEAITRANIRVGTPAGLGLRGGGGALEFWVGGPRFEDAADWANTLADALRGEEGIADVELDWSPNQPSFVVSVNRDRARSLGIEARAVSEALQALFASTDAGEYVDRGRQYPVVVQARDMDRADARDLRGVYLRADGGDLVPLDGLVDIETVAAPRALHRYNRLPAVEVSASLTGDTDLGTAIDRVRTLAQEELPNAARISFSGQAREFLDTSSGVVLTFGLAILVVFLVLAAQFESFIHPLTIMLTVPLGIAGALFTVLFTGQTLNIYSQVGMILLVGLMAKNGILIVEFANQLRDEGRAVREAIVEGASVRLRPILMTVASTLFGAVPLVVSSGAGAESRTAIGAVILGGFALASVFTLYVVPVLYDLLGQATGSTRSASQAVDRALESKPEPAE